MIQITVINWDQYNPRSDVKKSSWFRLEHDLFDAPQFTDFTAAELLAFVYVLSMVSRENKNGNATLFPAHAEKNRVKESDLLSVLKKLEQLEIVTIHVTYPYVHERARTDTCPTRRTDDTIRDGTDDTRRDDIAALRPATLQSLWNDNCHPLPKCKTLGKSREKKARAQLKLYPEKTHWVDSLKKLTASKFCVEEWKPGFDDWLDEAKRIRALEGKYDNGRGSPRGGQKTFAQQTWDANAQSAMELEEMKNAANQ